MTEDELWNYLDGFFAFDSGCTDSGISDPIARERVIEQLDTMNLDEERLFLSRYAREAFLSEDALGQGYGIEDLADFWTWFEEDLRR